MTSEAAPWAGKRYSYAGWVPNVHSHLSFSLVGTGRGPEVSALTRKYKDRLARFTATLQRRETDDFLAPIWWTRRYRPQAIQHFLLIGSTIVVDTPINVIDVTVEASATDSSCNVFKRAIKTVLPAGTESNVATTRRSVETAPDAQGMLRGRIFVFPRQKYAEDRSCQETWLANLRRQLRSDAPLDDAALDGFTDRIAREAVDASPRHVVLEFALFRTGEVRIWMDDAIAETLDEKQRRDVTRQSYFFIKDMVHHHVHHDAKSDQITPLTEIGALGADDGEEHWRRDTVWSLSRALDALARKGTLQDLREALGILAYADAFQQTLMRYRRRHDDPGQFEPNSVTYRYDFTHIRESLKVQVDQVVSRRTSVSQMLVAGLTGGISATALLASIISAHNSAVTNRQGGDAVAPGIYTSVLEWLAAMFPLPAIAAGIALWLGSSLILAEDRIRAKRGARRKLAQGMRGIANSIASDRHWSGVAVQRMLKLFLGSLFAGLGLFTWFLFPYVGAIGRAADRMFFPQVEAQAPAPKSTPSPTPSATVPPSLDKRKPVPSQPKATITAPKAATSAPTLPKANPTTAPGKADQRKSDAN
jgi:hypothetical protein